MSDPKTETALACCMTTVASKQEAQQLASDLLAKSLAACVQIDGPIESHYHWNGKLNQDDEFRLLIKTTVGSWPKLQRYLESSHPYDEPEIILIPINDASPGYRNWVVTQTQSPE